MEALFFCKDGQSFGRVNDASVFGEESRSFAPLYFTVTEANEVMSTEEPCDTSYEFGTWLLNLQEFPKGFPKPELHPSAFNDQVIIYSTYEMWDPVLWLDKYGKILNVLTYFHNNKPRFEVQSFL